MTKTNTYLDILYQYFVNEIPFKDINLGLNTDRKSKKAAFDGMVLYFLRDKGCERNGVTQKQFMYIKEFYQQGKTLEQIANTYEVSPATVRQGIHRGLKNALINEFNSMENNSLNKNSSYKIEYIEELIQNELPYLQKLGLFTYYQKEWLESFILENKPIEDISTNVKQGTLRQKMAKTKKIFLYLAERKKQLGESHFEDEVQKVCDYLLKQYYLKNDRKNLDAIDVTNAPPSWEIDLSNDNKQQLCREGLRISLNNYAAEVIEYSLLSEEQINILTQYCSSPGEPLSNIAEVLNISSTIYVSQELNIAIRVLLSLYFLGKSHFKLLYKDPLEPKPQQA